MSYKNTVKDYSQMIGFLTRDKTTDVPGSMAYGLRTGFYDGGRAGFDNGGRALYKEITPVTDANRASFMGAAKIPEDLKYKVQIPTRSDLSGGIPGLKTIYGKTKKELQEKINNSPITKMDYSKGLVKTKLPEGAVNFDKGRIKIPTGEFLGTGRNKAEIFIIKGKDPNAAIRYTAAGSLPLIINIYGSCKNS